MNSTFLISNMTSKVGQMGSMEAHDEPNLSLTCENACKNENEIHMIRNMASETCHGRGQCPLETDHRGHEYPQISDP